MLFGPAGIVEVNIHGVSRSERLAAYVSKLADATLVFLLLFASVAIFSRTWDEKYGMAALLGAILFVLFAEIAGLYRPWRGETVTRQFFQIVFVWAETLLLLALLAYAFKVSGEYARAVTGAWILSTPFVLSTWRTVGRKLLERAAFKGSLTRNAIVWGDGETGRKLAEIIQGSPWLGLHLVDCVADDPRESGVGPLAAGGASALSSLEKLELQAKRGDFNILYIALSATSRHRIEQLVDRLSDTTVSIYVVPDVITTSLVRGKLTQLQGIPLISVFDTPFWGVDGWLKRVEDVVLAVLFLTVAAVPMLAIALGVKLSSPGPILFKQRRYGMNGKEISVWKFRTMSVCEDGNNIDQAKKNDPRVTGFGRILRRTSLDELPQFINVLRGDMSIVGPRPHAVAHNELYRSRVKGYMLRHKVRPGITGWAQINGWRGETDTLEKMEKRVECDLWYVERWTLFLDLKIILLTVVRGFSDKCAY
jgi:putative colanic acid biosynthesis UDP-glucose lipid carrier transferase